MARIRGIFLLSVFISWAVSYLTAEEESITITTYYPSPAGFYNELAARRLVVGDDSSPGDDGVVNFQGLDKAPEKSATEGAFYYDGKSHAFRYYDGKAWRPLGLHVQRGKIDIPGPGSYPVKFSQPFQDKPFIKLYHNFPKRNNIFDDFGTSSTWVCYLSNVTNAGFEIVQQPKCNFSLAYEWVAIGD